MLLRALPHAAQGFAAIFWTHDTTPTSSVASMTGRAGELRRECRLETLAGADFTRGPPSDTRDIGGPVRARQGRGVETMSRAETAKSVKRAGSERSPGNFASRM